MLHVPPAPAAALKHHATVGSDAVLRESRPSRFAVQYARVTNGQPLELRPQQRRNLVYKDGVLLVRPHAATIIADGSGDTAATSSVAPPRVHPLFEWVLLAHHDRPAAAAALTALGPDANPAVLRAVAGTGGGNGGGGSGAEVAAVLRALGDVDDPEPELLLGPRHLVRICGVIDLALADDVPLRRAGTTAVGSGAVRGAPAHALAPTKPSVPTAQAVAGGGGGRRNSGASLHAPALPPPAPLHVPSIPSAQASWGVPPVPSASTAEPTRFVPPPSRPLQAAGVPIVAEAPPSAVPQHHQLQPPPPSTLVIPTPEVIDAMARRHLDLYAVSPERQARSAADVVAAMRGAGGPLT